MVYPLLQRFLDRTMKKDRLNPYQCTKTPGSIIRIGSVVVYENGLVAVIAKKSSSQFSYFIRCFNPTGSFGVEGSVFLQFAVLGFA